MPRYDRTRLLAAAAGHGDTHYTAVAARLGVSVSTAHRLVTGRRAPSLRVAAAVRAAYGLPPEDLLIPTPTCDCP
ncbi:helix-turn-helix domain-containing protein [Streptomyces sp. LE64]|uniref:helix-turn-helix domain-containing protein n=1 Tax=Streptomyces sp. LE64 TaxID=3448653 RepID=UPI0040426B4C